MMDFVFSSIGRDQCELLCKAENYGFFDMLADQVTDGTPCDETNVCIQGKCVVSILHINDKLKDEKIVFNNIFLVHQ